MRHPAPLLQWRDPAAALGLLTRLPIRFSDDFPQNRGAAAAWAYPLVGVVLGGLGWAVGSAALWAGLSASVAAGAYLACGILLTGGLHQDGLADTADGLWGGWTPERRLEIMKDSQIGTYGVLALILMLGLQWIVIAQIFALPGAAPVLIAATVASRSAMVATMRALPHARRDGLSASVGHPPIATTLIAMGLGALALIVLLGATGLAAALALCGTAFVLARIARARIGGQTGDILGATQQTGELAVLMTCAALL